MQTSEPIYLDVQVERQQDDEPPFPPVAHLFLKKYSQSEGHVTIGPNLMSENEVDELFDLLERDLERARAVAKRKLRNG